MDILKVVLAGFGLGVAIFAAMETEPEQIARRAISGILGLGAFIWVVMSS
jgi:hypothetical protein